MKPTSVAAVIVFLLLAVSEIAAQRSCTDTDEEPKNIKVNGIERGKRQFNIWMIYCPKEITAGRSVSITVKIVTELIPGAPRLEIKGVPTLGREDAGRIVFFKTDPEPDKNSPLSIQYYNYNNIQISEGAEPRIYRVQLNLGFPDSDPDKKIDEREFGLPVGVNSNGKLEVAKETQLGSFQASFFSTAKHEYEVKLRNFFRDYNAHIQSITVNSDPPGWISPITVPLKEENKNIAPTGEKTFAFEFDTTPFSRNLFRGFGGTPPQLKFHVTYNDGNSRELTYDEGRRPITISPSGWVLLIAMLLGLGVGAGVRGLLEFMVFKRKLTRHSAIRVLTYSLVFGLLVVLLSVVGQLEVKSKAFSVSGSYDNPIGMLTIGLVSAIAGLQIFTGWYNSLKSGE